MQSPALTWRQGAWRAVFVVVAIEAGLLLLALPWTPIWNSNLWLAAVSPRWQPLLLSPYIRGAVSGLGVLNLWAAASEITHLRV